MKWTRSRLVSMAVLMVSLFGLSACGGSSGAKNPAAAQIDLSKPPAQPVKIRVGWMIPGDDIKYVMMKRPDILKHYSKWYTVEWFQFQGTAPQAQAILANSIDVATLGAASLVQAADKADIDVVVTGQQMAEVKDKGFVTTWLVKKDSPINSVADLKGKTMAVNVYGSTTDIVTRTKLKKAGLNPGTDVKIVEVGFGQMEEALRKGQIDTGAFPQPFYYMALSKGDLRPVFDQGDVQANFVQLINTFSRKFINDNPGAVKAFQEDWRTAANFVMTNRDETIKVSSEVTKLPADLLQKFLITKDDYFRTNTGMPDVQAIQGNWDFMLKEGYVKKQHDVNKYIIKELLQ